MAQVIGYNVYRAADGSGEEFYGFVATLAEAKELAAKGRTLEECMYATAEAAGHCGGIAAPDKSNEGEVAEWFGVDGYDCAVEVFEKTYTVSDCNSHDAGLSFAEAVERIAEWYEDADQWGNGEGNDEIHAAIRDAIDSIEQPESGSVDELQDFADEICQAVALAMGGKDFYGHGNYAVSAASEIGLRLQIK